MTRGCGAGAAALLLTEQGFGALAKRHGISRGRRGRRRCSTVRPPFRRCAEAAASRARARAGGPGSVVAALPHTTLFLMARACVGGGCRVFLGRAALHVFGGADLVDWRARAGATRAAAPALAMRRTPGAAAAQPQRYGQAGAVLVRALVRQRRRCMAPARHGRKGMLTRVTGATAGAGAAPPGRLVWELQLEVAQELTMRGRGPCTAAPTAAALGTCTWRRAAHVLAGARRLLVEERPRRGPAAVFQTGPPARLEPLRRARLRRPLLARLLAIV